MYPNENENLNKLLIEGERLIHAVNDINRWLDVFGKQGYNWEEDKDMMNYLECLDRAIVFANMHMSDLKKDAKKKFWVEY